MYKLGQFGLGLLILWMAITPLQVRADQALLQDGRRATGILTLTDEGRLQFSPNDKAQPLPWSLIQHIEVAVASSPLDPLIGVRRVLLSNDQSLTGRFLGWGANGARLHPTGSEALLIPPQAIECVRHPSSMIPVFEDDFRGGLDAWKVHGTPEPSPAKDGLKLSADQAVDYASASPLDSGTLGVEFALKEKTPDGRWRIELDFKDETPTRTVQVIVSVKDREGRVRTNLGGPEGSSLACKPGRHRTVIEFGPNRGMITLDDAVLWKDGRRGFGGTLRSVRLAGVEADAKNASGTTVLFEGLSLARKIAEPRRPAAVPDQDEVWLPSGDQLYGRLVSVNGRSLVLEAGERRLKLAWSEVLGFCPRVATPPPRTLHGEWVRVWLTTGTPGVVDELEGVVAKLDDKRLLLQHPALGELSFDRTRLRRLRRLFFGERIELDNGPHHLGDKDRVLASVVPARAEGVSLSRIFNLDAVPKAARLTVTAVELKGPGDGIAKALERGELRTEVWINKERVDYLNRLVQRASARPQRLSLDLPAKLLRKGDNVVELRQTPDPDTGRHENCGLSRLAIETEP
jgi:hypothetical protein